jgi:hypothetical protein
MCPNVLYPDILFPDILYSDIVLVYRDLDRVAYLSV